MEIIHRAFRFYSRLKNPTCKIRGARLGKNVTLGKKVTLEYGTSVLAKSIGDFTFINKYSLIDKNVISIGKFCSIAYNVRIGLGGHPTNWLSTHPFAYKKSYGVIEKDKNWTDKSEITTIGNDVWIGANSTILAGVTIGDGAIVGAHSLVNKDVPPYSIVVGSPARHVRYRHSEKVVQHLLKLKWWDLSENELKKLSHLLDDPEKLIQTLKN